MVPGDVLLPEHRKERARVGTPDRASLRLCECCSDGQAPKAKRGAVWKERRKALHPVQDHGFDHRDGRDDGIR
jgi:hypothetical protein